MQNAFLLTIFIGVIVAVCQRTSWPLKGRALKGRGLVVLPDGSH